MNSSYIATTVAESFSQRVRGQSADTGVRVERRIRFHRAGSGSSGSVVARCSLKCIAADVHDWAMQSPSKAAGARHTNAHQPASGRGKLPRGLNQNHNHAMKEIFKGAALNADLRAGPFQDFYQGLLARGMKPELARVTLARKIAAITLTLWKKGECFDAGYVKRQAA